jgi:DNA-binding transcriptional LysR family regulator
MDIRHLRTFVTVARLGSVTKAAEALHITQPAVSGQLKNLEETLELKLFARTTSVIQLTQAGQDLVAPAEATLDAFSSFTHKAKALRGHIEGRLKIGVVMLDPDQMRVGKFMREMVVRHPALRIDLQVGRIGWFYSALQAGEIDAAITLGKTIPQNTAAFVMTEMAFRLVAPASWKSRIEGASWSDIALLPWIRTSKPSANHEMVDRILREQAIKPVELVEADHELLIKSLVAAGVGIGLIREDLANIGVQKGELVFVSELREQSRLSFVYSMSREGDPAILAAVEALRAIWQGS